MLAEGGGDWRPLNGRGVGYAVRPSPTVEMQRIEAEAAAQRSR
jgi:hypothetical protein